MDVSPPTGLIPWFSKTEGNTYATLPHHPFLFKGKTNANSISSNVEALRDRIPLRQGAEKGPQMGSHGYRRLRRWN